MVVAIDDLPPLLWHAELGRSLPDVWTGERQRGVQLHLLARRGAHVARALRPARVGARSSRATVEREHEDRLMEVIDRFDGRPFPTTLGLARQWLNGRVRRSVVARDDLLRRARRDDVPAHGPAARRRPARWYDPGRFWSGDRIELVPPFALGGEVPVRYAAPSAEASSRRARLDSSPRQGASSTVFVPLAGARRRGAFRFA